VALAVYAYDAGGATAVGVAALTRMVPAGLAAPLAGVLADRYSRRDVLLGAIALRAGILAAIGAAVAASAPLAVVLALAALFTIIATVHKPAQAALLPSLVETPHQLAASNALWSGIDNAAFLAGALLSGLLIATTSTATAFLVTAGLFALAAVPVARIARDPVPEFRAAGDRRRKRAAAYLPPAGKVYAGVTAGDPATYEQQTGAHAAIFQEFVTWGGAVDWALAAAEQNRSRAMLAIQTITP
jgi:MFS family permease